jgi:hypothetical protein
MRAAGARSSDCIRYLHEAKAVNDQVPRRLISVWRAVSQRREELRGCPLGLPRIASPRRLTDPNVNICFHVTSFLAAALTCGKGCYNRGEVFKKNAAPFLPNVQVGNLVRSSIAGDACVPTAKASAYSYVGTLTRTSRESYRHITPHRVLSLERSSSPRPWRRPL